MNEMRPINQTGTATDTQLTGMSRRRVLTLGLGSMGFATLAIGEHLAAAHSLYATTIEPLVVDDRVWRQWLSDEAFDVLRREATERAFTSPLDKEKREGTYLCAGCFLPLFSSQHKYDSGTGWPSFWRPIDDAHIGTKRDFKLIWPRTEYHCQRCKGHQGHVFNDGPEPTGERWCNNGVALRFIPKGEPLPELRRET